MDVTAKLLKVFQVDKQLRGLRSRLNAAEAFLKEQNRDLNQLAEKRQQIESGAKLAAAQAAERESEVKRLDAKLATLREQMNTAQTNKQYQAFLVELNTFKTDRDKIESAAIELLAKAEDLRKQLGEIDSRRTDREKVRGVAQGDRDARFAEIEARLKELQAQRDQAAAEVPKDVLAKYNRLLEQRGEDAMGAVEVQDKKRHEYTCGVCQMSVPIQTMNGLLSDGRLTLCASCQCVLYLDEATIKLMQPAASKR